MYFVRYVEICSGMAVYVFFYFIIISCFRSQFEFRMYHSLFRFRICSILIDLHLKVPILCS